MPENWESGPERGRRTVVLNVWGNHVFTYDTVARNPRVKTSFYPKARVQTLLGVKE